MGEGGASVNLRIRVAQHLGSVSQDLDGDCGVFSFHIASGHEDNRAPPCARIHVTSGQIDAEQFCAVHSVRQIRHRYCKLGLALFAYNHQARTAGHLPDGLVLERYKRSMRQCPRSAETEGYLLTLFDAILRW